MEYPYIVVLVLLSNRFEYFFHHWCQSVMHDQDWESVLVFFTDIAASCGHYIWLLTFSITAEIKQRMALLLICGVVIWHRYTLIIQELRLCEQMDSSGLDVCMVCMSRLFVQCEKKAVWLPCRPTVVAPVFVFHDVLLVVCCCLTGNIGKFITHGASLPVRFPVCLALHGPPDGKCLLLITHRWTERTENCVCTFVFVCLWLCSSLSRSSFEIPKLWYVVVLLFLTLKHLLD